MKIQIRNYGFDPIAKTVTFKDYTSVSLDSVLLVVNVTTNTIIYNFANPATGGTISGNVLTLPAIDELIMASTDKLLIYYDVDTTPASDESVLLLRRLVQILAPIATQDINQRQRVTVDGMTAGMTLTTVGTVGNIGAIGGVDVRYQLMDAARNMYANGIRQNLIFS